MCRFSLVAASRLLIAVVSLVVDSRMSRAQHLGSVVAAPEFESTGSVVVAHRLSCFTTCVIFLDLGSNPGLIHWHMDS